MAKQKTIKEIEADLLDLIKVQDVNDPTYKAQHYLSQFYMRGFSTDKINVWVKNAGGDLSFDPIKTTAQLPFFYSFINDTGQRNVTIELFIGKYVETPAARLINNQIQNRLPLNSTERMTISSFASIQLTRTPRFRKYTDDALSGMMKQIALICPGVDEKAKTALESGDIFIENSDSELIKQLMSQAAHITEVTYSKKLTILCTTPDMPFITSDSGIGFDTPNSGTRVLQLMHPDGRYFVPLSATRCLLASYRKEYKEGYVDASRLEVMEVRSIVSEWAQQFLIGLDEKSLSRNSVRR